jgi:hypothetical protein
MELNAIVNGNRNIPARQKLIPEMMILHRIKNKLDEPFHRLVQFVNS